MVRKRLVISREAWEACTATPSHSLVGFMEDLKPGEEVEIVGDEEYAPLEAVVRILTWRWRVEVVGVEREGHRYVLRVRKVG
ncbi:MAG: hypothetical protein QXS85_04070 [Acidilobaceae archaeon]